MFNIDPSYPPFIPYFLRSILFCRAHKEYGSRHIRKANNKQTKGNSCQHPLYSKPTLFKIGDILHRTFL